MERYDFEVAASPSPGPLADLLREHGAEVIFSLVVRGGERLGASVLMPEDPDRAEECRRMIKDWLA